MDDGAEIESLIRRLRDPARRVPASAFPLDPGEAACPGLYTWWADKEARLLIAEQLGDEVPVLVYAGEAGATRWPSGTRSEATLASRIGGNHLRGNEEASTFRKTVSAILKGPWRLEVGPSGRLTRESNERVTAWICGHLQVAVVGFDDRDSLEAVEEAVLECLDPPLNLRGRPGTPMRQRLSRLRADLRDP